MPRAALTNRQRKAIRKAGGARPRKAKTGTGPKVTGQTAAVEKPEDRDGLEWLIRKGRLGSGQSAKTRAKAGRYYRRLYRDAPLDGTTPLRSCLDDSVRGGGGVGLPPALVQTDAAVKLHFVRAAISHHEEMTDLLDAVCGRGTTVRSLACGNDRRAVEMETALRIALDLVALAKENMEASGRVRR